MFEGKEVEGFEGVLTLFIEESSGGENHVNVRVGLEVFAEGVQA